jgi:soluble lytic murein transglycosylase
VRCATFFERYGKSYVAEKLRADWIRWLGKRFVWNEVDAEYPG